jgi:C-terminal processing protease CtpA/Prc
MKRLLITTLVLTLSAPASSLLAGDEKGKEQCPQSAATCAEMMREQFSQRGWVGINMEYDKEAGVTAITNVVADSPAAKAGFQVGDVLRALNGVEYAEENEESLKEQYASFRPGSKATFSVDREGERLDLEVELERIPEAILAQWVGQHILDYHQAEADLAKADDAKGDESP